MYNTQPLDQIAHSLQRRYALLRRWSLGLDVLLGVTCVGFLATVLCTLTVWPVAPVLLYSALAILGGVLFALLAWPVRLSALTGMVEADRVLRLQERLSTAYEYVHQEPTHPFVSSLTSAANQLQARIDVRQVFPVRLPRRLWGIPLLIAATIGFSLLHVPAWKFDDVADAETSRQTVQEGQRLEKWGRSLEEVAKREQLDRSLVLARQMQQLGQRMQREGAEKGQATERIATLTQYLRRMQQELQERALIGDAGLGVAQDVLVSGKSVKQELRDILQMLQHDSVPREMTAAAEQSIARMMRQVGPNPELENLLQSLRAGDVEAARQLLRDALQQQQASEEMEQMDRARQALEYATRTLQRGNQGDAASNRSRSPSETSRESAQGEYGDNSFAEDMPGMEDFASPGMDEGSGTPSYNRNQPGPLLRESAQPASKVDVKSGEGTMRLSYVRHLPLHNEAQVPVEEATVQYQRAAEEVLLQEQIPRDYREQIKQYFLALGMMK